MALRWIRVQFGSLRLVLKKLRIRWDDSGRRVPHSSRERLAAWNISRRNQRTGPLGATRGLQRSSRRACLASHMPERIPPEFNVNSKKTVDVIADSENHFVFEIKSRPG